jgi:hypothetical protein
MINNKHKKNIHTWGSRRVSRSKPCSSWCGGDGVVAIVEDLLMAQETC